MPTWVLMMVNSVLISCHEPLVLGMSQDDLAHR